MEDQKKTIKKQETKSTVVKTVKPNPKPASNAPPKTSKSAAKPKIMNNKFWFWLSLIVAIFLTAISVGLYYGYQG